MYLRTNFYCNGVACSYAQIVTVTLGNAVACIYAQIVSDTSNNAVTVTPGKLR